MHFGGIGISNLPNQHSSGSTRKEQYYNIVVAGGKGLGKTTFLNNLVRKNIFSSSQFLEKTEFQTKKLQFFRDGTETEEKEYEVQEKIIRYDGTEELAHSWFEEYKMTFEHTETEIAERGIHVHFSVLEIDRIGDSINNEDTHVPIVDYINNKYKEYFQKEQKERKDTIRDERVHACLYFYEPTGHSMSEIDLINMKAISEICVLVPVIGRSDAFTMEERELIRLSFQETVSRNEISFFKNLKNHPFFIVGNHIDEFGIVYERQYPWGGINANNKYMSDTEDLKNLIIRDQMLDVIEEAEIFYRKYRNHLLRQEIITYLRNEDKLKTTELAEFNEFLDEWCTTDNRANIPQIE